MNRIHHIASITTITTTLMKIKIGNQMSTGIGEGSGAENKSFEKTLVMLVIGGNLLWYIDLHCQCLVVVTGNGGNFILLFFFIKRWTS